MPRIYLDNAATSFPKPACVTEAMVRYATSLGTSARGAYREVKQTAAMVDVCRQRIVRLISAGHHDAASHVIFTLNTTDAMNLAIHGVVRRALRTLPASRRVHLVTSELDHNSALRPFNFLQEVYGDRVMQTRVRLDPATGVLDPADFARAITDETILVATLHASNVTGAIQPAQEIGRICREKNVLFLLDAAQSLGHVPVDVDAMGVDLLAMPGHKGLLGPTGTGALYIRPGVEDVMDTVREGGTGQRSELEAMPTMLPDRFEPGSHNTIGIVGLSEAVGWILKAGLENLRRHELKLIGLMLRGLCGDDAPPGLRLLGPVSPEARAGVFSFTHEAVDPTMFGNLLETKYGILSRSGLHCAPVAHSVMGIRQGGAHQGAQQGATRLSVGPFTTEAEVESALAAVRAICTGAMVEVK